MNSICDLRAYFLRVEKQMRGGDGEQFVAGESSEVERASAAVQSDTVHMNLQSNRAHSKVMDQLLGRWDE